MGRTGRTTLLTMGSVTLIAHQDLILIGDLTPHRSYRAGKKRQVLVPAMRRISTMSRLQEHSNVDIERHRKTLQPVDRHVRDTTLELRHIRAMKIGQLGQALLAEPAFRSEFANIRCNAPARITFREMFRSHSTAESDRLRRINLQNMNLLLINLNLYDAELYAA